MPVGVDNGGGARLVEGSENDDKIVRLALGDDANENAFQQNIGVGADMIFGTADEQQQARIMRRVNAVFARFEAQKRFLLRRNTVKWTRDSTNQELILEFQYVSVEADEERDFRQNFAAASGSTTATLGI
jgi:hypothetical protein